MGQKYFGTDGIRGRVGEGWITPEFMLKLGWAAGQVLGNGPGSKIIIGKDTRKSGYMFEASLEAGLVAAGMNIHMLGPMPTPAIAYLTRTFHAQAGIVISASHNPHYDNGIKFFSGEGKKLPDDVELAIEEELQKPLTTVAPEILGKAYRVEDASGRYIEFCKSTVPLATNFRGMKIVVDCAHGATYRTSPFVFSELGAEVITIGDKPDGLNINDGVGSTHVEKLVQTVLEQKADLGIAMDGDGDRLIMVDHEGQVADGDDILYIIAMSRKQADTLKGPVVGTLMSNLGFEHALAAAGVGFERTKVGDRHILERLEQNEWTLGGEPSGHIICRDRTTTGDGTISALQVLAEIWKSGKSLKELLVGMKKYPQDLININLGKANAADVMAMQKMAEAVISVEHELGNSGRVLLRPSGTEPLIRVMVEGEDGSQVSRLAGQLADVVKTLVA
ncbi:MAG: phosphoglucosamine mutase [Chromatiales bacterium]|jgi:phosphoglucosamine mutase